ncbi:hypothetical protein BDP27DRAFT_1330990 [Rhodocollybia butyracea]|uniref:Nephrocystin 3-like N-terminal domain-containing protein n=1 Tax=Rhodocollybia butyracea TaxID=206335 RepID=A0A9P5U4Z5_9AGAR|nr:hypothetical protein BDP27DRAFT_1330990 [Rhodocollybia butyracea]
MRFESFSKESGSSSLVIPILEVVHSVADVFGPLKSASGGALWIAQNVKKFKQNQKEWVTFGDYVQDAIACVISTLPAIQAEQDSLCAAIERLDCTLKQIQEDIDKELLINAKKNVLKRTIGFLKEPNLISELKQDLDKALQFFQLQASLSTSSSLSSIIQGLSDLKLHNETVKAETESKTANVIKHEGIMNLLPYAEGASYDPQHSFAPNSDNVQVFILTGAAGAGKSAISHSIAQRCAGAGHILSCFFFNRDVDGRNTSDRVVSTLAHELAHSDVHLQEQIAIALKGNRSLLSPPISRQLQDLIINPSRNHQYNRPVTVVLDALDEGAAEDLLKILRDEVKQLPNGFRIFATTRREPIMERMLLARRYSHVVVRDIDLESSSNLRDVELYAYSQLQEVREACSLDLTWPGKDLEKLFVAKAEGLFLWVATVCDYLRLESIDPEQQLVDILGKEVATGIPAEEKMDKLYGNILARCPWGQAAYADSYGAIVGAIMTLKIPLTSSAIQALLGPSLLKSRVESILQPLSSLLIGVGHGLRPIKILHLSFRDFLTQRARLMPLYERCAIDTISQDTSLAHSCLSLINRRLTLEWSSSYFDNAKNEQGDPSIPSLDGQPLAEELAYSCQFWVKHVEVVMNPSVTVIEEVRSFLLLHAIPWMEVTASQGGFQSLEPIRTWLQSFDDSYDDLIHLTMATPIARSCSSLSYRLSHSDRFEEAMTAALESVAIWRRSRNETDSQSGLAEALYCLSLRYTDHGDYDNALSAADEAVTLYQGLKSRCIYDVSAHVDGLKEISMAVDIQRELIQLDPRTHSRTLAFSLALFSDCLLAAGQHDAAYNAAVESIDIYQSLVGSQPALRKELSDALLRCSNSLVHIGRTMDALAMCQEAIEVQRKLVHDWPSSEPVLFSLSTTVHQHAWILELLERYEEAVPVIQEAIQIRHELAKTRPITFKNDEAHSLLKLCGILERLGRLEEKLAAGRQAVDCWNADVYVQRDRFRPMLALASYEYSLTALKMGLFKVWEDAAQDAFKMYVEMADESAEQSARQGAKQLAIVLGNTSWFLSKSEKIPVLPSFIEESVERLVRFAMEGGGMTRLETLVDSKAEPPDAADIYKHSVELHHEGKAIEALRTAAHACVAYQSISTSDIACMEEFKAALVHLAHCAWAFEPLFQEPSNLDDA